MEAKVSVIVPAYNAENTLARCLDSLLSQTYSNKEILVVDDGSTDRTASICDTYALNNSCIKVLHQLNSGVSIARNAALDIASGEYIVFVDSDDAVAPQYIDELMRWKVYDYVTAGYRWQAPDMTWYLREFAEDDVSQQMLKSFPSKYMGKYYFGSPWATLMKKALIDKGNLRFDADIHSGEDTLFIFKYLRYASTVKIVPMCGYHYYFYSNSLVNRHYDNYWKWKIQVEREILDFFQPCNELETAFMNQRCFDVLRDLLRDYSVQRSNLELHELFINPFFKDCISHKRTSGNLKDRILIFAMDCRNYSIYKTMMQIDFFFLRVKRCLKLIWEHRGVKW